ncbi:hypothetical protein F9Z91_10285 [Bacteroides thetaiotaomicron]|nr:hypothetical protein F9Z91_10285 [Bacteroides thetaiotaomicron]
MPHNQLYGILKDKIFHICLLLLFWLLVTNLANIRQLSETCQNQAMNCCKAEGTIADSQGFISSATNNQ